MLMHKDDIKLAREIIAKEVEDGPYGPGLTMPYALLRLAVGTIEQQNAGNVWTTTATGARVVSTAYGALH